MKNETLFVILLALVAFPIRVTADEPGLSPERHSPWGACA